MFSIYSSIGGEHRQAAGQSNRIENMLDIFLNLVDLCQAKISEYKEVYHPLSQDSLPSQEVLERLHTDDSLLRDYYSLLNKVLGFGVISFFDKYDYLSQLARFAITSIQLNQANSQLSFILEKSKMISDQIIQRRVNSTWCRLKSRRGKNLFKKITTKQIGFGHADEDDEFAGNFCLI